MAIILDRLPEDVERGAKGGARFSTSLLALSGGQEQRNAVWEMPLSKYDISYGIDDKATYTRIIDFFHARLGRQDAFLFKDWTDFEADAASVGVGNAHARKFILYKDYIVGDVTFRRRITRPIADTVQVFLDDVEVDPANYTLGAGGWILFNVDEAPADGSVVTWSGEFDVPVRFNTDELTIVAELEDVGSVPSIDLVEVRDPINAAPTAINFLRDVEDIDENTVIAAPMFLCDIDIVDDPFGVNVVTLTGGDSEVFELGTNEWDEPALYLKAGTLLDYEKQNVYEVNVVVDDETVSPHPAVIAEYSFAVNDVNEAPILHLANQVYSVPADQSTATSVKVADIIFIDDALFGSRNLTLSGPDASSFIISGSASGAETDPTTGWQVFRGAELHIKAGVQLGKVAALKARMDIGVGMTPIPTTNSGGGDVTTVGVRAAMALGFDETVNTGIKKDTYRVTVNVDDPTAPGGHPSSSADHTVTVGIVAGSEQFDGVGNFNHTVRQYAKLKVEQWAAGAGAAGVNNQGFDGTDSTIVALSIVTHGGKAAELTTEGAPTLGPAALFNAVGGRGGVHTVTGGTDGEDGANGAYSGTPNVFGQPQTKRIQSGKGGDCPLGGVGGQLSKLPEDADLIADTNTFTQSAAAGHAGADPGGGGSGACWTNCDVNGQNEMYARPGSGSGEYFVKEYIYGVTAGAPEPGAVLAVFNGNKGDGGDKNVPMAYADGPEVDVSGGDGGASRTRFTWS